MTDPHRFRPTRAGIVNLYEYGDQELTFADGRLLLRGHNTSGKTKALELLLPFVLDGDISPRKLDPFAQNAKEMRWNLVGCADVEQRRGYVWIEFERMDDAGDIERVSAGIGLQGHRARSDVRRWYFAVRGRRIGRDLALTRDGREPIGRADLVAAIGDDGLVFDRQSDYREHLREAVFAFATAEQYRTMLMLMLELRRPHLSKTLDPAGVAELLSAGLPEVDGGLMRSLAGGLEQLEALEASLARRRQVREQVRAFHEHTYRSYVRAALRDRASALRAADSAVGRAAEQARTAAAEHDQGVARHAELAERLSATRERVERLDGEERALVTSAAWSTVAEVEQLRQNAEAQGRLAAGQEERHADDAARAAGLEAEHVVAGAALEEAALAADGELDRLDGQVSLAGLGDSATALGRQLRDGSLSPPSWRELLDELAAGRSAILAAHAAHLSAHRAAAAELDRATGSERAAADRAADAVAAREGAQGATEQQRVAFSAALAAWREDLDELHVELEALTAAREHGHAGHDPRAAFTDAVSRARTGHADGRARGEVELQRLSLELNVLEQRRAALEAEQEDPPLPPAWRTAPREDRDGAPLWALVDFAPGLAADERAAVEAALDAAGLLDAWITPDGAPLAGDGHDSCLTPAAPADGPTLSTVLRPVSGRPVAGAVLARVLDAIGLDEGFVAIDRRGRFRLGPLAGSAGKPAAEHIGATARRERRERLLAELAGERAVLEAQRGAVEAELAKVAARGARLDDELATVPSPTGVAEALRAEARAADAALAAERGLEEARAVLAGAADAEVATRATVRDHATKHGLGPGLDAAGIAERRDACLRVGAGSSAVMQRFERLGRDRDAVAQLQTQLAELRVAIAALADRARVARAEATRLKAEHRARDAALGVEAREVRERHQRVADELRAQREAAGSIEREERSAELALAGLANDVERTAEALEQERSGRGDAHARLVGLARAGLLPLALGGDAPADHDRAAQWPMTRALEVARGLPAALIATATSAGAGADHVLRAVSELDRALAQTDMGAHVVQDDELLLVQITDGAGIEPLAGALAGLDAEISEREQLLSAEERRVFSDALVEELAEHLRARIHGVRAQVERINAVLRRATTAGGKLVLLEWEPSDDGELRRITGLLHRSTAYLGEADRQAIVEFFRQRVEVARRDIAAGRPEPMAQTLAGAFDYRRWFAFVLRLEVDGRSERLTRRSHAAGSGGEQSALIHLPLFAAAAALYGDGPGPRLVMLDEALSGIDDATRERVLAATVAFDLDLVMTSHELWGTYASVPSLAIYQLHRENGVYGVHAIRFLWDGEVLREDEQGELFVA